jgi:hypothetical protein
VSQAVLFFAIHLVGLALCLAWGPRRHPALCCALAFPAGLAAVVLLALALLVVGIPYSAWSLGAAIAVPVAAAVRELRRRPIERRALVLAGWWTAAFAVLLPVLVAKNVAVMTHDSFVFVQLGEIIARDGALAPDVFNQLDEWGVFEVVALSLVRFTSVDFLYALPLVLGISFVPLFGVSLACALGDARRPRLVAAVAAAALFTNGMMGFHITYLHTNLGSAIYLFAYVVLFWLAEVERDPSGLPAAFLCLIAFALQRTETPILAVLFLALTIAQSELPRAAITRGMIAFTIVVGLWFEALAHYTNPLSAFLTPTRCRIVWATLVLALGWWLVSDRPLVRRINRWLPAVIAGLAALALVGAFVVEPEHMWTSSRHWVSTLRTTPHWGWFWYLVPLVVLAALPAPAPRFRQAFVVGIPVFFAFVLLLALGRDPYAARLDDSANRMTIHIVPLIVWYLALKAAPRAETST